MQSIRPAPSDSGVTIVRFARTLMIRGGATVLGFLSTIIFARLMDAATVGALLVALALLQWLGAVARLGVEHHVIKALSTTEPPTADHYLRYGEMIGFAVFNAIIIAVILALAGIVTGHWSLFGVSAVVLPLFAFSVVSSFIFQSQHRIDLYVFVRNLLWQGCVIVAVVLFYGMERIGFIENAGLNALILGFCLNFIIVAAVWMPQWRRFSAAALQPLRYWVRVLRAAAPFTVTTLVSMSMQTGPVLVAGMILSGLDLASFTIFLKIAALQMMFVSIVNSYAGPKISQLIQTGNGEKLNRLLYQSLAATTVFVFGFIGGVAIGGEWLLALVYGDDYAQQAQLLILVCFYQSFKSVSAIIEYHNLLSGNPAFVGYVALALMILGLGGMFIVPPELCAWPLIASAAASVAFNYLYFRLLARQRDAL